MEPIISTFKESLLNATSVFADTLTDWTEVYSKLYLVNHYSVMAFPSGNLPSILKHGVLPSKGVDREREAAWFYDIHPGTPRRILPPIGAVALTSAEVLELFRKYFYFFIEDI